MNSLSHNHRDSFCRDIGALFEVSFHIIHNASSILAFLKDCRRVDLSLICGEPLSRMTVDLFGQCSCIVTLIFVAMLGIWIFRPSYALRGWKFGVQMLPKRHPCCIWIHE